MEIGAYTCETPFVTDGSGNARWCTATRDGQRYFLKQFLVPVYPAASSSVPAAIRRQRRERCVAFEQRKSALYSALNCVLGDCVVPVADFFIFKGRYYTASEYVASSPVATPGDRSPRDTRELLYELAVCLSRLHAQGVVHGDLKPDHILLQQENNRLRLIDFDGSFLEESPPREAAEIECDPAYMAPETFLCVSGEPVTISRKADTFAFGAIVHKLWTGELPVGENSTYLYEAVLKGAPIRISRNLPTSCHWLVRKCLSRDPENRPDDGSLLRLLAPPSVIKVPKPIQNGLVRYLRPEVKQR
ncbi:MAG: protein kinase [Eubacteriales bacterium]|nr:protein kinase [Eubacteriales bacterium]